jgi:phospholipase C
MESRRDFLKKAALLTGGASLWSALPASIQRAFAIDPPPGSTYLDAEHIVILMQENRSFDHSFGTLRGVRGFNDPRAITLPSKNPVWFQSNAKGETYAPFRLNIKETKSTWMSSLPHSWTDQVDARNGGKCDKWLDVKQSGHKEYAPIPLTMGYYTREDLPFYYALADAFTICDQNFCSSLTGTTPNRLYLWTGTIREKANDKANVRNEDVDYSRPVSWTTFPERLEENGISWKIYQNEISLPTGFSGEEDAWLANFTDNPLEWFTQYHVKFSPAYNRFLQKQEKQLSQEVQALEEKSRTVTGPEKEAIQKALTDKRTALQSIVEERSTWSQENFDKLPEREKNLHRKAFTTNQNDPDYHHLSSLHYQDGDTKRELVVPKGDVLHQFREDVKTGQLPTVSWLVAPENFSDHPGAPWYGAWYVSETLDILTQNSDVWKKTIFILAYDENDGWFDHVPPFVAPHPNNPHSGLASEGIDTSVEHVSLEQELQRKNEQALKEARESPIGLGYRVPLVVASPWSRGGYVCSQVFDHTSILQFLEKFLTGKFGKPITETNISSWRRAICGDLTSVFQSYTGEKVAGPEALHKEVVIEGIHKAKFKQVPTGYRALDKQEIERSKQSPAASPFMPQQEKGVRPSSPLPYELYANSKLSTDQQTLHLKLEAKNGLFGTQAAGSPFTVYAFDYNVPKNGKPVFEALHVRQYAVAAGEAISDSWLLSAFNKKTYQIQVHGPNGFFREFRGNSQDPLLDVQVMYGTKQPDPQIELKLLNFNETQAVTVQVKDNVYQGKTQTQTLLAGKAKEAQASFILDVSRSFGWYDFSVSIAGNQIFEKRYAGRVETGKSSFSDPLMGRVIF